MSRDLPVIDGVRARPCVRCGLCCKQATCVEGLEHGAASKGCTFLRGDRPGAYYCGLVADSPEVASDLFIGEGCCSPLNSDRQLAIATLKSNGDLPLVVSSHRFRPGPLAGPGHGAAPPRQEAR